MAARTISANSNQGNIIPGFAETTGGVNGVGGKLGMLYYDDNSEGKHSNQYIATDFELACCGSDVECKPKPPKPGHYTVQPTPPALPVCSTAAGDCSMRKNKSGRTLAAAVLDLPTRVLVCHWR